MSRWGFPEARARIAPAPVHPNEHSEIIESRRGRQFERTGAVSASAAQFASVQLFNPSDSLWVLAVDRVVFSTLTTQQVIARVNETALTTLSALGAGGLSGKADSVGQIRTLDGALPSGPAVFDAEVLASTPVPWHPAGRVLLPGFGLVLAAQTAQTVLRVVFHWRELQRYEVEVP